MIPKDYDFLLSTLSGKHWQRIGVQRRAGVAVPLFSVYSGQSAGIGELPDLKLLIDWCGQTGLSIIQLLPLNDVGFNFRPYDAQSSFALDPMYLSLKELAGVKTAAFSGAITKLKNDYPAGEKRVNYHIKAAKLNLLWEIFNSGSGFGEQPEFEDYCRQNAYWLEDYCLFKVIKEKNNEMAWEGWSPDLKHRNEEAVCSFKEIYRENLAFHQWLQWQLFRQFQKVKKYAQDHNVLLMGDLPFLVSRDSADTWAWQDYFKLHLSSGAPPDMMYSKGQRWGMPPYAWDKIARDHYRYPKAKLKYAQNFYDLYRIDHVVGIFRVWTIPLSEAIEHGGLHGAFDPKEESLWEEHGKNILSVMIQNTDMLACAEDLGMIPECCFRALRELGVPGIDVGRWIRDWGKTYDFKDPKMYRKDSLATIATHDMSGLCGWWEYEAGTIDEEIFRKKCQEQNIVFESIARKLFDLKQSGHGRLRWKDEVNNTGVFLDILGRPESTVYDLVCLYKGSFSEQEKFLEFLGASGKTKGCPAEFVKKVLEKINASASIFSVQLLHDWLSLDTLFDCNPWDLRINFPGTVSEKNWTMITPISLEDMIDLPVNSVIKSINQQSGRAYG